MKDIVKRYCLCFFGIITLLTGLFSCGEEDNVISFTADQTSRLLSNDSTKTWLLVRKEIDGSTSILEPCEIENTLVFGKATSDALNTLLFDDDCDESVIYDGFWQVLNQRSLPTSDTLIYLFNPDTISNTEDAVVVDYDTILNIIDQISSQTLIISREDTVNQNNSFVKEYYELIQ